jgi:DNA-binding MarR family transcriptional regulator
VAHWLLRHPLQRDTDLALALQIHPTTIYRHLLRLEQTGGVEWITPSGKTARQRWYYLTHGGVLAVAAKLGASPGALAQAFGADEAGLLRLIMRLPVVGLLQQIINGLVAHAPSTLAYPNGERARLTWHWQRDWRHVFVSKGHTLHCRADAVLVFQRAPKLGDGSGDYFPLLFLADGGLTGLNDHRIIEQRLERLLRYRESAERTAHFQTMPPVAILVAHPHQQERWQRAMQEISSTLRLDPLSGAVGYLPAGPRLDSAWVLPWKRLESDAPCRLQDLLFPTDLAALPGDLFPAVADSASSGEGPRFMLQGGYARRAEQARVPGKPGAPQLLSLQLSEGQRALLHVIYTAPLLSTEEISSLSSLAPATTTRLLYDLRRMGCLELLQTRYGRRWRMSHLGLRWLAGGLAVALVHLAESAEGKLIQRGVPLLERTLQHTVGVYRFLSLLHAEAAQQEHQVTWWETGSWCERRYHEQGAWHALRPDAAFEYHTGLRPIRAWLEWDEGTMTGGALAAKLRTYAHYLASREWVRERHALPLLLIVTPEPGQERRVSRPGAELAAMGLRLFTTTATRLSDQGPLAPIWQLLPSTSFDREKGRVSWLDSGLA